MPNSQMARQHANSKLQTLLFNDDLERKLSSDFASKAPPHIVTGERERLEAAKTRLAGIEARLKELE